MGRKLTESIRRVVRSLAQAVTWLDRFTRTAYFGLTGMLVLIGAATATDDLDAAHVVGLLLVAVCFHVYSYVLNDVIDLEVDATQPRRAQDPLVRGLRGEGLSRGAGLVFALLPIAPAALVTYLLGAVPAAWLSLGGAFGLICVYNLWGKRFLAPPVTDFFQGCGWAMFALYGAWMAGPTLSAAEVLAPTLPLLALTVGLIVLITGIHGGLRDLVNDLAHGRTNASIFLGAKPAEPENPGSKAVASSIALIVYSFAWLALMFWPALVFVTDAAGHYANAAWHGLGVAAVAAVLVANAYLLWQVTRLHQPDRDPWISRQAVVILLPAFALYLPSAVIPTSAKWVLLAILVLPPLFQVKTMRPLLARLERLPEPRAPQPEAFESRAARGTSGPGEF